MLLVPALARGLVLGFRVQSLRSIVVSKLQRSLSFQFRIVLELYSLVISVELLYAYLVLYIFVESHDFGQH